MTLGEDLKEHLTALNGSKVSTLSIVVFLVYFLKGIVQ